ncbi:DNA invertase Pin-like site-specific DNA recombinase [Rhizobium pisi]|uniref:DNA invertase Pin-like site-specific DNA recombinase n=1 Tax=Rhizobium pisi TaxID=574561 RepID=A0A7W5G357_9HYPH|nr:DNA invertase Pin-like site-specific DNA recombinase [Rhizobium pisi]
MLVVVRLDRLARSVSHLLQVIENLEQRGVHFKSIRDPIDTSTLQGMFSLQVLGAVAQLERALIAERTKAGIKAAKGRGKLPGNPGLRERRPEAIKAVSKAREKIYLDELISSAQTWLPRFGNFAQNIAGTMSCGSSIAGAMTGPWKDCAAPCIVWSARSWPTPSYWLARPAVRQKII